MYEETIPSALSSLSLKCPNFGAIGDNKDWLIRQFICEMLSQSLKEFQMAWIYFCNQRII